MLKKVDRTKYREYIECANKCRTNRVYPVSIATGTQSGEIYTDNEGCVLFWHYCGFAYISGNMSADILDDIYRQYIFHEDTETCTPVYTNYYPDYETFYSNAASDIEKANRTREYGLDAENHPNWFDASYISCRS